VKILVIDDEVSILATLERTLTRWGHAVVLKRTAHEGLEAAQEHQPEVVLLDVFLPDLSGVELLPKLKATAPRCAVVMITGVASTKMAVKSMKLGAEDYLEKPFDLEELKILLSRIANNAALRREGRILRESVARIGTLEYLPLIDPAMQKVYADVERVAAQKDITVLILGETGVGKAHVARLVHDLSERSSRPFIEVHCGALPETLLESELFGHEAGAFTDARKAKPGLLEMVRGGTAFLDEMGELPLSIQAKLLKVLETKTFRRLGGLEEIRLDGRLVAATNRDLGAEAAAGRFRTDLFYRLSVFPIWVPPLRDRPRDVEELARFFATDAARSMRRPASDISPDLLQALKNNRWDGNVRELKNVITRMVINSNHSVLGIDDLQDETVQGVAPRYSETSLSSEPGGMELDHAERVAIQKALRQSGGNRSVAAKLLKVSRPTLLRKIRKYGLEDDYDKKRDNKTGSTRVGV
jgi:DNA-binding NtrC family response regulator